MSAPEPTADPWVDAWLLRWSAADTHEARSVLEAEHWREYRRRVEAGGRYLCGHGESDAPCLVCRERWSERGRNMVGGFAEDRRIAEWWRSLPPQPRTGRGFNFSAYEVAASIGEVYDAD